MIYLRIILRDDKVKDWIEKEHIKTSTVLTILKKNLGYKNRAQIIKNISCFSSTFINTRLCWRTDAEYSDICCTLNGLVKCCSLLDGRQYYYGKRLLEYVEKNGVLTYVPYYRTFEAEERQRPLLYWTLEKTIERWIKEKF
jgi:hypothetical protein